MATTFEQARAESMDLPKKPDNMTLLKLYSLYKQGQEGDVSGDAPGGFDMVGKAKYNAWEALRGTPKEEAQRQYIELVNTLRGK